ncbi:MAG: glycosyltransferase family 4 protein [Candidatus Eremiobacteraeota bacterium]|nr:glycosyltransferase family 4 protein [Candidatus Eremiobacteraeota bacterium]
MRILVVAHAPIRDSNRPVYRELARQGHAVTLLVPDRWKSGLGPLRVEPEIDDDGSFTLLSRRKLGRSHPALWTVGGIGSLVRSERIEAVYVDEDPASLAAWRSAGACRRHGAALVVLAIQNLVKRYPFPFDRISRFVIETASAAVYTSDQADAVIRSRGFTRHGFSFPFTTDLEPLAPLARAAARTRFKMDGPTFAYVGRLVPEKGVDLLLRALADVGGARVLLVGDGPERANLEALAQQIGIAPRVSFTGVLPPADAALALAAADALVLPSRTATNWAEQFGRVLIEAMASGVPVVASDSGAIPEVVGDAGIIVPEGSALALGVALRRVLEPEVAEHLSVLGLQRARDLYSVRAAAGALATACADGASNYAER